MRFDFEHFPKLLSAKDRIELIKKQLAGLDKNDPVYLSDCLVRQNDLGTDVLCAVGELDSEAVNARQVGYRWKLKVIRDEWGNVPMPGDIVEMVRPKNRKNRDHQPVSPDVINAAMADGSYATQYEIRRQYVVDEKGCIECIFEDAVDFLRDYGIHSVTGYALPHGKPEHSTEPCRAPDGSMLHVWYWRYKEVDAHQYSQLKKIKVDDPAQPKRGLVMP